ncbi:MAG: GatB/YqeY domain-containing protein [Bryobacterales bacterium]|nr:GatB/YqeY domain-containing protein [Bryobacteraceae bacterium]MDW8129534.1 GatB/YqeY domain-containing protein [Bryobacterales bacterium]
MALLETIEQHMREAMKARDELRLSALRMIKSALTKHRADTAKPLDEKAELQVLNMLIKQRREAAEAFRKGGREDLAAKEEAELRLIESYLPAPASEEEMEAAIEAAVAETGATSPKQMGAVMKAAQARLAGKRVDNKLLSEKVRARLGG